MPHTDHELIVLNGKPGSGKSRLGKDFVELTSPEMSAYFSVGDHMRKIARGEQESVFYDELAADNPVLQEPKILPPGLFNRVFEEYLEYESARVVLVDGLPKYKDRVEAFYDSASLLGATVLGSCNVVVSDVIAMQRMLSREQRVPDLPLTEEYAMWRLEDYHAKVAKTHEILAADYPAITLSGMDEPEYNALQLLDFYRISARQ